jgi:hypothetical protein
MQISVNIPKDIPKNTELYTLSFFLLLGLKPKALCMLGKHSSLYFLAQTVHFKWVNCMVYEKKGKKKEGGREGRKTNLL